MQGTSVVSSRRSRSVLKVSLGISFLAVVTILGAVFVVGAPEADAATCTWSGGAGNWSQTALWTGCGAFYPGQNPGDSASFAGNPTVDVNVPNGVIITMNSGTLAIPTGGHLQIESSSTIGSFGGVINVNGGDLVINGMPNLGISSTSAIVVNSGTASNLGALTIAPGQLTINGGTFTNSSSIAIGTSTLTLAGGT